MQFCHDSKLVLSSMKFLPVDSYTYSEAWHTTSWLDHVICTADAHESLEVVEIVYGLTTTDHLPVSMMINVDNLPDCSSSTDGANRVKVDWAKLSKEDVLYYCGRSDVLLREIQLPMDAILCPNINCDDVTHCNDLCEMYNSIVSAIHEASRHLHTHPRKVTNTKPGWNKYVADHQEAAKAAHRTWVIAGRPRQRPDLEHKKRTNARYKYAVRFIGKHENSFYG